MDGPIRGKFAGLAGVAVAGVLLWQAVEAKARNERLAVNPHERALITRTWATHGKHGGRYADLSFTALGGAGTRQCRVAGVRLGSSWLSAFKGQSIEIAPIPGSCAAPDVAAQAETGFLLFAHFGASFATFMGSLWAIAGARVNPRA